MKDLFCVGDRVVVVGTNYATQEHLGHYGTVRIIDRMYYGVEFDEHIPPAGEYRRGHNLDGAIDADNGWWCLANDLELVTDALCPVDDLL